MIKTLQTMVSATDTVYFAAVAVVSDAGTMVFFTHTRVPIPETGVLSNEKIFPAAETIFPANQKMVSGFATMALVFHTKVSAAGTMVWISPIMVEDLPTMFLADVKPLGNKYLPLTTDFDHGRSRSDHGQNHSDQGLWQPEDVLQL